jgi:hypothetical protein
MEITGNKATISEDGKSIVQEVKYSDPYNEVKVRVNRRGNQTVVTGIDHKKK